MKRSALIIMIILGVSKVFGFARELVLSYFYGVSNISDIYLVSLAIPTAIFGFISTGISTGYIPLYSKIEVEHGKLEANKYTNNLINILLFICTIVTVISLFYTEGLVSIFAAGFEGDTLNLAIRFTRINLFSMYFLGLISVFSSFLQIKGKYIVPSLIGIPMNIIIIISILLSSNGNILILAFGSLFAIIAQVLFILPSLIKEGYKHNFIINIKDNNIKQMFIIALPVILGSSVNQINTLVDKTIASRIVIGGISALNYSEKLSAAILGIVVTPIITVIYPTMSKMVAKNDMDGVKTTLFESINIVSIIIIPASIGMMIFAEEIVKLTFNRGAFTDQALTLTVGAFFFYTLGNIGYGLRQVLYRVFYSLQDTRTPMINASVSVIINIVLNIILSRYFGINGLALATSLSAIICLILLFISMGKKIGSFGVKGITLTFLKVSIASIIMGIVARSTFYFLGILINDKLALALSICISAFAYFILVYILKVDEINILTKKLKDIIDKRKNG